MKILLIVSQFFLFFNTSFANPKFVELNCSPLIGNINNGIEGSVRVAHDQAGQIIAVIFDNYIKTDDLICSTEGLLGLQCKGFWIKSDGSKEIAVVRLNQLRSGKFSADFKRSDENGSEIITFECR